MKMKITILALSLLLLAACVQAGDFGDLPKYEKANPDNDLKAAIARNDLRFKALRGYAEYVPGVNDYYQKYSKYGLDVIKGTSDVIQSYEHGRLTAIAEYYANHYNIELFHHIQHLESMKLSKKLLGYDAILGKMKIEQETTGQINSLPESFHAQLVSLKPRCVNLAWWFDPIANGQPTYNWNQFLAVFEEVNGAVCQHKWIQNWVQAGTNRNAEAQIFGLRPYTETDINFFVKTAWTSAGLGSEPYYEINLREGSEWAGTIYIGKDKQMALITTIKPSKEGPGKHWLDGIPQFSYHPNAKNKEYIVVEQNGKWRKSS